MLKFDPCGTSKVVEYHMVLLEQALRVDNLIFDYASTIYFCYYEGRRRFFE